MTGFRDELRAGWRNLLAATIGLSVGIPAYTPVSSLFLRALEQQFGWSKAVTAGASIAMPITAVILPLAGLLIDRIGVRITTGFSVVASIVCYLLLSRLDGHVGLYYAAVIALNMLGCATGPIGYTRLLAAQFRIGRGTALAIAQFGIALVAVFLPPLLGHVMAQASWRAGYLVLATLSLFGGIAAQLLMRPVRLEATSAATAGSQPSLLRNAAFWRLGLAVVAISVASLGLVSQFQSVLIERGVQPGHAVWLLSLLAVSVMLSRLAVGALLDRRDPRVVSSLVMLFSAGGAALLVLVPHATWAGILGTVLVGASLGAELDLLAFFCARLFGLTHYARNYGALSVFFYSGIFCGAAGFGALRDASGSYASSLWLATALLAGAAGLFMTLPKAAQSAG